jgi:[ribosomal protein S5]-alanine N-acetyltransferase
MILREFTYDDSNEMYSLRSDPKVMAYMDSPLHSNISESRDMIGEIQEAYYHGHGIHWAMEWKHTGKMIGYLSFWRLMYGHVRGELGYALKPALWGRGYMKEALSVVLDYGFNELGLHSAEAQVNPGNKASIRLLGSFGFKKEAHLKEHFLVDGRFVDSVIYSLLETDYGK